MNTIPRSEYPRPNLVRPDWLCLNGQWEFEIDWSNTGCERGLHQRALKDRITVPFCPESELSGIGMKDFMPAVWYRKEIEIPPTWRGRRVIAHFGAVDYQASVYVNGRLAGSHTGGYTSFGVDITPYLQPDKNILTVCAQDDLRTMRQPSGKQSPRYESFGCMYTRTTGIWQSVWLEPVAENYIENYAVEADPANKRVYIRVKLNNYFNGIIKATASLSGTQAGFSQSVISGTAVTLAIDLKTLALWQPSSPTLYGLRLELCRASSQAIDSADGYFGMRSAAFDGYTFLFNGQPLFQRLVLDQGFYPDGIYTAPTEQALIQDIKLSQAMGYNGARLHQKVFEPRFLYWADKLGYLCWGEYASWGFDITDPKVGLAFLPQWLEAVERDRSHPSIITWCPFNETWDIDGRKQCDEILKNIYLATKAADSRPVVDTSGNYHVITDIYDIHDYEQQPQSFCPKYADFSTTVYDNLASRQQYGGQPYMVTEYGGTWWDPDAVQQDGWGYGERPRTLEELYHRFEGLTKALLDNPKISGFCYTQLYDVGKQECNGLYTYGRKPKFDVARIRDVNTSLAACEKE